MSEPYTGEIRIFAGTFAPVNWNFCDGSLVNVSDNDALFALIGTTYGGDGVNNFALPDLRGRLPVGVGQGSGLSSYNQGQTSGAESIALTAQQIPPHQHTASVTSATATTVTAGQSVTYGTVQRNAEKNVLGLYTVATGTTVNTMAPLAVGFAGNNAAHENRMNTLAVNYIICLYGIFPSRP